MGFAINSSDDNESEIEANLPISNIKPTNITNFTNEETIIHYSQLFSNINIPEALINDIETKENEMNQKDPLDVENNIQESINKELFQFNNNEEALEFTIPPLVDISSPEKEIPKAPNLIPISALKKKPSLSLLFRNYPDDLNYSDSENKDSSLPKLFLRPGYMNTENETINSDVATIDSDSFYKIENFLSFSNPTEAENNNTFVSSSSMQNNYLPLMSPTNFETYIDDQQNTNLQCENLTTISLAEPTILNLTSKPLDLTPVTFENNNITFINAYDGKKKFKCTSCPFETNNQPELNWHLILTHSNESENDIEMVYEKINNTEKIIEPFDMTQTKHIPEIIIEENLVSEISNFPINEEVGKFGPYGNPDKIYYVCTICKYRREFRTMYKQTMRQHLYRELRYFRYQCHGCEYKSLNKLSMKLHCKRTNKIHNGQIAKFSPLPINNEIEKWVSMALKCQTDKIKNYVDSLPENLNELKKSSNISKSPIKHSQNSSLINIDSEVIDISDDNYDKIDYVFKCKYCWLEFQSENEVILHVTEQHLKK